MHNKEAVREILVSVQPNVNYDKENSLVKGGLLDSFDIITIISELSDAFEVEIEPAHMVEENFCSLDAICRLIDELSEG